MSQFVFGLTCFLFIIVLCASESDSDHKCSPLSRSQIENHLSTKTPYRVRQNLNETPINIDGCQPTRIWSIIRHGTRNPGRKDIKKAKKVLSKHQAAILNNPNTKLCPKELDKLKSWYLKAEPENEKFLVAEGEDELIELAERMQKRFPSILVSEYSPSHYLFKYTATQRTLKSAESFCTGLFGRHKLNKVLYPIPVHKDPILRFYKLCTRWKVEVDKNPKATEEVDKFIENSPLVKELVDEVREITQIKDLNFEDVSLIYKICGFETAWNRNREHSPWCNVFRTLKYFKAMEFLEDLDYYYVDGYGFEITHKQACPAMKDMFEHIDPTSTHPNATFYFTHSGTVLKLLSHLGLYKDDFVLTHNDFDKDRKFKTSEIDAFASNIHFILYECDDGPKVLTMHQEKVVTIPGCPVDGLCELSTLRSIFKESLNCNFDEICQLSDSEESS